MLLMFPLLLLLLLLALRSEAKMPAKSMTTLMRNHHSLTGAIFVYVGVSV